MATNFYIPAGGEGQRLRPLTEEIPKPLLPVSMRGDGTTERIIDTPVDIARRLGSSLIVAGSYRSNELDSYFSDSPDVQVVHDTAIVQIGGSMLQHRDQLFEGCPDAIAMVPGDHYLPEGAVAKMLGTLSSTGVDLVILGTWKQSYHERYGANKVDSHVELAARPSEASCVISSLGTYIMSRDWLARRLDSVPVGADGHCDLTTGVVFGKDQAELPRIAFEPLLDGEPWEDVGTIRRLYDHIRSIHPASTRDEWGNVNLSDESVAGRATDSVVYFGASRYLGGHVSSFIADNFFEQCAQPLFR